MNYMILTVAFVSSVFGAAVVAGAGMRMGLTDYPDERSSHITPVPKGGGLGILAAFVLCSILLGISFFFVIPVLFLSLMSFFHGDRNDTSPKRRLIFQFSAAAAFLVGCVYVYHTPVVTFFYFFPLAVFMVGTANFFNFMDGINGIAGLTGGIAFGALGIWGGISGKDSFLVQLALCISMSCLGFLPFNFPKARVFMGDVGSILLGFLFSGFVILFSDNMSDLWCLSGFLFPFYADELSTMIIRLKQGDSLTEPHRKHLYQILANEMGYTHSKITCWYGLFQAGGVVFFCVIRYFDPAFLVWGLLICFTGFTGISFTIRKKCHIYETSN